MEAALPECRTSSLTPPARKYNIPRKTLTDRLNNKVKGGDQCQRGRPSALTAMQEESLCAYIKYMAECGFPMTVNQIIMYAW